MVHFSEAANQAVHALAWLTGQTAGAPVSVNRLAEVLGVSPSHLAKVMQRLVKGGFIGSTRGARGGFFLQIDPHHISVLDIIEAIDGEMRAQSCLLGTPICEAGSCLLGGILEEVTARLRAVLSRRMLSDFRPRATP